MERLRRVWARLPAPIRITLSIAFWLPVWLIVFGATQVLVEEVTPSGGTGAILQLLIYAILLALVWRFMLRPSIDRAHGGSEKRRSFQSAIRTGVISPDADRERLSDAVERFNKGRKVLWIVTALGAGLLLLLALVPVALHPPIQKQDLVVVASQAALALIIFVPVALFIRRRDRQYAALKEALDSEERLPPSERDDL